MTVELITTSASLAGHKGHLSPSEADALETLKGRLAPKYYTPASGSSPASQDDTTLLRFLRARKFDVEGAYSQFTSTEEWRQQIKIDELYDQFDVSEYDSARSLYTQWTGRRTLAGLPLYEFKISALTKEAVGEYSKDSERLDARMAMLSENLLRFTVPLARAIAEDTPGMDPGPIAGCVSIVNVSNVSLTRFWSLRNHLQRGSALATAHYPETLATMYIVGAPGFFSTVWGWIAKWFDPGTVEKIFILAPNDVLPTLSKYIAPENIPKEYGGSLDWGFGDPEPSLGLEEKAILGVERIVRGTNAYSREKGYVMLGRGHTQE